ncbi:unknown [Choristoneura occidentalis granulovirus]|uniref:ORF4 n=2 Tax=Betabaculovirus chofumiferanae TaxID=3051997 RepID=Q8JL62_GVCF|nr:unknown [Choristoneura fumiferana granulovirus]AAM60756.1 ORF4 [Choristoneura fumiferana granulovirus]ABC61138.1 unknown [Choristoneura fumiferana granulovirus]
MTSERQCDFLSGNSSNNKRKTSTDSSEIEEEHKKRRWFTKQYTQLIRLVVINTHIGMMNHLLWVKKIFPFATKNDVKEYLDEFKEFEENDYKPNEDDQKKGINSVIEQMQRSHKTHNPICFAIKQITNWLSESLSTVDLEKFNKFMLTNKGLSIKDGDDLFASFTSLLDGSFNLDLEIQSNIDYFKMLYNELIIMYN